MTAMDIECGGFTFVSNFDSGNLARVELVPKKQNVNLNPGKNSPAEDIPDFEFNVWTKPDCAGTEFENSNRTWFYFGIKGGAPFVFVKLNIVNLNRQSKMYSQGMAPVFRMVPGRNHWDRIKEKPSYTVCTYWREKDRRLLPYRIEDDVFILSFKYRTLENIRATTYFAFTYPYSHVELQNMLNSVDARFRSPSGDPRTPNSLDDIYYHRECVCYSLEGRVIDLITISSYHSMSLERETRLKHLFPITDVPRPFRFYGKKVVFVSARVHPGETPSSFVLNGLLNLLLARDDPVAILLRKMYVFKLIPMLNPDGVSQGHYRTDTRGVNLNRMYLNPAFELHPPVFAARSLIRYYHHGQEIEEEYVTDSVIPNMDCESNLMLSVSEIEKLEPGVVNVSSLESLSSEKQDDSMNNQEDLKQLSDGNRISNIENQVSGLSLEEKQNESPQHKLNLESSTSNSPELVLENNNLVPQNTNLQAKKDVFSAIHDNILSVLGNGDITSNNYNDAISVLAEGQPEKSLLLKSIPPIIEVSTIPLYIGEIDEKCTDDNVENFDNCFPDNVPSICKKVVSVDNSIGSSSSGVSADLNSEEDCIQGEQPNKEELTDVNVEHHDPNHNKSEEEFKTLVNSTPVVTSPEDSGLYLYVDLHGHASKKGIFMYGNYFEDIEDSVECMLLPKIMSLNSQNFHFTACNFTERNMYLRDRRDGMSREGSGRVAVLKTTGLVRSYTLECNYNTGRFVNTLPPCIKDKNSTANLLVPPKYTPQVFEEVGRALGISILDLTGSNPWSRIPHSEFHTLSGIRDWLRMNCLPEQNYILKMVQGQKQVKRQPCNTQVGGMAGMSVGVPPRSMRPSSSKSRLTNNKRDTNFVRTRRLAPLVTKSSEAKVGPGKVSSGTHVGILCHADLKSSKSGIENVAEDSERKENLSSFQVGSCSQTSSCVKVGKVFTEPKENIGPCSSQRCPGTSKKLKSVQSSNSGVLKQVLAVRSKCAAIGALAGGSKMTKGNISSGRMQRITAVGSVAVAKKGTPASSPTNIRIAKFRRSSTTKLSPREASREECPCLEAHSTKSISESKPNDVGRKGFKQVGIGSLNSVKSSSFIDKARFVKDEPKILPDQTVVKQGPKRLKMSAFRVENASATAPLIEVPHKNEGVLISKMKLKDVCMLKVGSKGKKLPKKCDMNSKSPSVGDSAEFPNLSREIDVLCDSSQIPQDISLNTPYQNSSVVRGKSARKKTLPPQSSNAKSVTPVTRASISDSQGTGSGSKVKYSTKSEKQGKGRVPSLSPIKTLQKKKSTDSGRKRGKVSLRNLATGVGRFRSPTSEPNQSMQLEKKRKKFKSKFP